LIASSDRKGGISSGIIVAETNVVSDWSTGVEVFRSEVDGVNSSIGVGIIDGGGWNSISSEVDITTGSRGGEGHVQVTISSGGNRVSIEDPGAVRHSGTVVRQNRGNRNGETSSVYSDQWIEAISCFISSPSSRANFDGDFNIKGVSGSVVGFNSKEELSSRWDRQPQSVVVQAIFLNVVITTVITIVVVVVASSGSDSSIEVKRRSIGVLNNETDSRGIGRNINQPVLVERRDHASIGFGVGKTSDVGVSSTSRITSIIIRHNKGTSRAVVKRDSKDSSAVTSFIVFGHKIKVISSEEIVSVRSRTPPIGKRTVGVHGLVNSGRSCGITDGTVSVITECVESIVSFSARIRSPLSVNVEIIV